jgi:hypothetical protein
MEAFLMEKANVKQIAGPVDLNTAAVTGARIDMKNYKRVAFVVTLGDSTSATLVAFTTRQHNAASAGTSKDLVHANPYYYKAGAATVFTKVEPSSAAALVTLTTAFADEPGVVVIEVLAEDLDRANDFAWVSLDIGDSGAAKIGAVVAVGLEPVNKPAYSLSV